ncbi:MAG: hypothetical protein VX498_12165 [Myxococcota bacterium]|nr:hypothetical protein [Myxococcota bacterium]
MRRPALPLILLLVIPNLTGCLPFGLGGTVDGRELDFVSATYFELRGVDPATSIEFHRIELWLTPMEEPCTSYPELLSELASLRLQIDDESLSSSDYCNAWQDAFESSTGLEGFWLAQFRLNALPREEFEDVETEYLYIDDSSQAIPGGPHFDASLAWYPPSTFAECAAEFEGDTLYEPDLYGASGGTVTVTSYTEDEEVTISASPSFPSEGDGGLQGQTQAEFCPAADDWPVEFGLGL